MDQLVGVIASIVFFGLALGVGEWILRRLEIRLASRLRAGWRRMTLPIAALLCVAGFLALRPLILDQPRTPVWFALAFTAIALLFAAATAIGYALFALGRWFVSLARDD